MAVDRDKILKAAQKLVDRQRYAKAIDEYLKLVDADPSDVRTLLKIGDLHLKLSQHAEAITTYEKVGNYYYRNGFSVKAIAVYKQIRGIIRRHARHLEGRYGHVVPRLAEIYAQLGLTSDALAAYDEVASRLRQNGRERDALDIFNKAVALDPDNPIGYLRVADSLARLGDIPAAVQAFGAAADIMLKLDRLDDAIKVLERLLEYRAEPKFARLAGQLYLRRGRPNDGMAAISKLQIAFKADPKNLDTLAALAAAFDAINQPAKAVEVMKEAARIAHEVRDEEGFDKLMKALLRRAPDDAGVKQLVAKKQAIVDGVDDVEIEIIEELDGLDEVLELDEVELQQAADPAFESALFMPGDPAEISAVRRLVMAAEVSRGAGKVAEAIQLLRDGLRNLGAPPQLRHKLADLLLEAGDQVGCIAEKLVLAQELANTGSIEPAVEMLDEVLLLDGENQDAIQMRANFGFPLPGHRSDYDEFAPMQSYDVESGGVDEALAHSRRTHSMSPVALDDPFGGPATAAPATAAPATAAPRQLDEDALYRAEVFAEQGHFDQARAILTEQLRWLPNHPLVLERLADVDAMSSQAHVAASGQYRLGSNAAGGQVAPGPANFAYTGAFPPAAVPAPQYDYGQPPPPIQPQQQPQQPHYGGAAPAPPAAELAPEVDAMMHQVRQGVRSQVADGDAATHYDLGLAYQEMGLYSDAISELMLAARDATRACVCLSLIGTIQLQLGELDAALDAFHRALESEYKNHDQEQKLGYEIANTYELKYMHEQALHYFEWLASVDPQYDDPRGSVYERIERLTSASGTQPRPQAPSAGRGGTADLDDALDDLFENGS